MVFYKMKGNEFEFQIKDFNVVEDFSVWDDVNKRYFRGNWTISDTKVSDMRFLRAEEFGKRFPTLRKNTQYVRKIYIMEDDKTIEYDFGFKKTANDDLGKAIATAKGLGINPFEVKYRLRKIGDKRETTYSIIGDEKVGIPKDITVPSQNQPQSPLNAQISTKESDEQYNIVSLENNPKTLEKPKELSFELDDVEKQMVELFKSFSEKCSEERYLEIWEYNEPKRFNIRHSPERIREVFKQTYYK